MSEHEIRADERKDFENVLAYFKRQFKKDNPDDHQTRECLRVIDGLASEVRANWGLSDSFRYARTIEHE